MSRSPYTVKGELAIEKEGRRVSPEKSSRYGKRESLIISKGKIAELSPTRREKRKKPSHRVGESS